MKAVKAIFQTIFWLLIAVAAAGVLLITFLTVTEYRPTDVEELTVTGTAPGRAFPVGQPVTILSWNVGYGALGKDADFVMDGGGSVPHADQEMVRANLSGIAEVLKREGAAVHLLQEADSNSSRSFGIDFRKQFPLAQNSFALNYSCQFVPFPWPPFGRIQSGLLTASDYDVASAERISLPCPFSWPLRTANLKRCLLVSHLPIDSFSFLR